jgi:hypothetical protein
MNTQEFIDQKLRLALGNMHVELILAQARIAELEEQCKSLAQASDGAIPDPAPHTKKGNGKDHTSA